MLIRERMHADHAQRRRAYLWCACILVALCAPVRHAHAQATPVPAGTRVRVDIGGPLTGTYLGARHDTLLIEAGPGRARIYVPLSEVRGIEVSTGRSGHAVKGAVVGTVLGAIVGVAASVAVGSPRRDGPYSNIGGAGTTAVLGGAGALVGLVAGAAIGARWSSERWVPVLEPRYGGAGNRDTPPPRFAAGYRLRVP